jgi:hypothetical protein
MLRRRTILIITTIVAGLFIAGGWLVWPLLDIEILHADPDAPRPAPRLFAQSDSPDGRFRCVIMEQTPARLMDSPYTYTFTLFDRGIGTPLKGDPSGWYGDSCAMDSPVRFDWTSESVSILEDNGSRHNAWIRDGKQIWQAVAPNTIEADRFDPHQDLSTSTTANSANPATTPSKSPEVH